MEALAWSLAVVLIVAGLAGVVIPGLPGAVLILAAAVAHKLLLPSWLSWWTVAGVGLLVVIDWAVSLAASVAGARWAGATRAGVLGAGLGLLVGMFLGLPGMILGPLAGALVGEIAFARREAGAAAKAALGTGAGLLAGTAARLALAAAMVTLLAVDWFLLR